MDQNQAPTERRGEIQDHSQRDALAKRYGAAAPAQALPWNATLDLLLSHRSVRSYTTDDVPDGTLEAMVAAAQSAATSSNLQTWSVVVIRDVATREKLAAIAGGQKHIVQCPLFMVWVADVARLDRVGEARGVELVSPPYLETFLVAAIDAALAAQNAVVAAESFGLSTVYIGALRNDVTAVAAALNLPPGAFGVFGLCVGTADMAVAAEVKPRLPPRMVLHHERYDATDEAAGYPAYDDEMRAFSERNAMGAENWTGRVIQRTGSLRAMGGRDHMVAALHGLGFPLK